MTEQKELEEKQSKIISAVTTAYFIGRTYQTAIGNSDEAEMDSADAEWDKLMVWLRKEVLDKVA